MSSPELQKMSKIGSRRSVEEVVSDDSIQIFFNKSLESKRKEASVSFQEKHKQNKIQPTSVYDSDLIKEAFKSPLTKLPPALCDITLSSKSPTDFGKSKKSTRNEIEGQFPDKLDKKMPNTYPVVPTGVGEGLLTEYIMAIEKGSHNDELNKTALKNNIKPIQSIQQTSSNELQPPDPMSSTENLVKLEPSVLKELENSMEGNPLTPLLPIDSNWQDHTHSRFPGVISQSRPQTRGTPPLRRPSIVSEMSHLKKREDLSFTKPGLGLIPKKDSFSSRDRKHILNFAERLLFTKSTFPSAEESSKFLIDNDIAPASSIRRQTSLSRENPLRVDYKDNGIKNREEEAPGVTNLIERKDCFSPVVEGKTRPKPIRFSVDEDFELKPVKNEDDKNILTSHDEKEIENIIISDAVNHSVTEKIGNCTENNKITIEEGSEGPTVLIGNKRAEVRVEKWIREEFAEAKKGVIEEVGSDDDSSVDHFAQPCDEKWIQDEFDHDDDEDYWIKDEISGTYKKSVDLKLSTSLSSPSQNSSPGQRKGKLEEISSKIKPGSKSSGSPKWQIDVKTISAVKPTETHESKNDSAEGLNKVPSENKESGRRNSMTKTFTKFHGGTSTPETSKIDSSFKWQEVDLKQDNPVSQASTIIQEPATSARNLEETKTVEVCKHGKLQPTPSTEGSNHFIAKEKMPFRALEIKQVKASSSSAREVAISNKRPAPVVVRKIDDNSIDHKSNSSERGIIPPFVFSADTKRYQVFNDSTALPGPEPKLGSLEFGAVPVLSHEMTKMIQNSCTKFCYDCLSFPSYVDEDLEFMDGNSYATARPKPAKQNPSKEKNKNKDDGKMKKKMSKLFNRLSSSVEDLGGGVGGANQKKY